MNRSILFSGLSILLIIIGISFFFAEFLRCANYIFFWLPSVFPPKRNLDPVVLLLSVWLVLFGYYGRRTDEKALFIVSSVFMAFWVLAYAYADVLDQTGLVFDQRGWNSRTILFYAVSIFSFWGIQNGGGRLHTLTNLHRSYQREHPIDEGLDRYIIFVCLIGTAVVYAPVMRNTEFRLDDFFFFACAKQHGLVKSLMIPHMDNFLPLYRLFMGGLYLLSHSGRPIRAGILLFHFINTYLVFHIVKTRARSNLWPLIAAAAFGFSPLCSSCLTWLTCGHWVISLTFILLMSMSFDRFINDIPDRQDTDEQSPLSYGHYFTGLIWFALALGTYTLAFFAGPIIWLYMYTCLLRKNLAGKFHHVLLLSTILGILSLYLGLRFIAFSLWASATPFNPGAAPFNPMTKEAVLWGFGLPGTLYMSALRKMTPQLMDGYLLLIPFLLFLLIKRLFSKSEKAYHAGLMVSFAILMLLIPIAGRFPFFCKADFSGGNYEVMLQNRYFYYPLAAMSIASGLLLDSLPQLKDLTGGISGRLSKLPVMLVLLLSVAALCPSVLKIRAAINEAETADFLFAHYVSEHRMAMVAFLNSPDYSCHKTIYFRDGPVSLWDHNNWLVRKSLIFALYFHQIGNVRFVNEAPAGEEMYQWTAAGVVAPEDSGESVVSSCSARNEAIMPSNKFPLEMTVVGDSNAVMLPPDILPMPSDRCAMNGASFEELEDLLAKSAPHPECNN